MRLSGILYLVLISFFFSCQGSEEKRITRLVKEWEGKEIVFPNECSFSDINGNSCEAPTLNIPFKFIYYVDSIGCMSCKLKLEEWNNFIKEADSISGGKISPYFYFHPRKRDLKELRFILKSHAFNYPVCVDTMDMFNVKNQFPENDSFHAFLLDSLNRVTVIGNPIQNPSIKDLYIQVLTGKDKKNIQSRLTQISISETMLELGNLELGATVKRIVKITNTGNTSFIVKDVVTSCDCVKAKIIVNTIKPKEIAELLIEFTPDKTGEFFREVSVFCNTKESPIIIQIHGYIK